MKERNDFMELRKKISDFVTQYEQLRKNINWEDPGKSDTIKTLARPFLKGYFTVAVAGKMSAGKSTFINSLIGENLLPTGHFQTTSGITWIVSSNRRHMEVTFADGHKETYTRNFSEALKKLVAVPEEFDSLPINDINILISGDDDINEILKKKAGIEEKTGTNSEENLWRKYVKQTKKRNIAKMVVIELVLPEQYEGWRIVDTPGIGAIGGIQDATKDLLTKRDENDEMRNEVDAVILLHNGQENIQDESAHKFADEVARSMGDLVKGRLFFVLTHAATPEFLNHKDGILSRARNLFGKGLGIADDKILYVDSLAQRFINDAEKSGRDFSKEESFDTPLAGWEQDWEPVASIASDIRRALRKDKKELSNSNIFAELTEIANYDKLTDCLYDFLNNEKSNSFSSMLETIYQEYQTYKKLLETRKEALSQGKKGIENAIAKVRQEKIQLDLALGKIQQEASKVKETFQFLYDELFKLLQSDYSTDGGVRTAYKQIENKGIKAEHDFFQNLKDKFSNYSREFNDVNLTFESLDLDALEKQAGKKSLVTDKERPEVVIVETHCCSPNETKTTYPYKKTDWAKKVREFKALVVKEGRKRIYTFIKFAQEKSENFLDVVGLDIKNKQDKEITELNNLQKDLANKDAKIAEFNCKIKVVDDAIANLNQYKG